MEMVENLLLDFDEAKGNREEQWVICEVAAMLFLRDDIGPLFMLVFCLVVGPEFARRNC